MAKAVTMSFEDVYAQLEAWGSEKVRAIYVRGGAGENLFGVTFGNLRGLAKKLKTDHDLAMRLWATGNTDAMLLASMIMAGDRLTEAEIEEMLKPLTYTRLLDEWIVEVVARSPHAESLRERWMPSLDPIVGRAGWYLLVARLMDGSTDGLDLDALLATIEAELLSAPTLKQEAMNRVLVEIGTRIPDYTPTCIAIGERLGRFDKRPVPKGCTSSYAPEWIAAVLARKK